MGSINQKKNQYFSGYKFKYPNHIEKYSDTKWRAFLNSCQQEVNWYVVLKIRWTTDISLDIIAWKSEVNIFNGSGDIAFWNVLNNQ